VNRNALRAFVVKEFHHILRDRQTLTILLMMPLVQVILFGYALRSDVKDIRMAIVDPAPDHATLELQSRFVATGRYSRRAALGLALGGIPGVLIAAFIVKSMDITTVRWLVVGVVLIAATMMLRSAAKGE